MPFCPRCGTQNSATVCTSCGFPVPAIAEPQSQQNAQSPATPKPPVGLIIGIVGAAVAVLTFVAHMGSSSPMPSATEYGSGSNKRDTAAATKTLTTGDSGCTPSDFKIRGIHESQEYSYITIVGTIVSSCSEAAAPQIKVSLYDKKGALLDTDESWPLSVSNMAPHSSYEFKAMMREPTGGWQTYSVSVLSVRHW